MNSHTRQDEIALWKMYIYSGIRAIAQAPDADGISILQTIQGNECTIPMTMGEPLDSRFIDSLIKTGDTRIAYMIYIWKNHWLDIPPFDLRQALLRIDPENKNTRLLFIGEENFIVRSLESIM